MARDATARLYDVDDTSVVFKRPAKLTKYAHGSIHFRARKGKLIDLGKLHESVWATRLSGGTRSGLVRLQVAAVGNAVRGGKTTVLNVAGSKRRFLLAENPELKTKNGGKTPFQKMREALARGEDVVRVTGRVDGWNGRWPAMLRKKIQKPYTILVSSFEIKR